MTWSQLGRTSYVKFRDGNCTNPLALWDLTYGPHAPPIRTYAPPPTTVVLDTSISLFCTASARPGRAGLPNREAPSNATWGARAAYCAGSTGPINTKYISRNAHGCPLHGPDKAQRCARSITYETNQSSKLRPFFGLPIPPDRTARCTILVQRRYTCEGIYRI